MTTDNTTTSMKRNPINEFLWFCTGADRNKVRQCPETQTKYACMGGIMLFTAIIAATGAIYVMKFVFPTVVAVFMGVIWELVFLTFNRLIVGTLHTPINRRVAWGIFHMGPRILIGAILAGTLAFSIQMKVFEHAIDAQIASNNTELVVNPKPKSDLRTRHEVLFHIINSQNSAATKNAIFVISIISLLLEYTPMLFRLSTNRTGS